MKGLHMKGRHIALNDNLGLRDCFLCQPCVNPTSICPTLQLCVMQAGCPEQRNHSQGL